MPCVLSRRTWSLAQYQNGQITSELKNNTETRIKKCDKKGGDRSIKKYWR